MNVSIISTSNVTSEVLDDLARNLPVIISKVLEVPGGKLAILKPEQVSLEFSLASVRDVGPDIRITVFARKNIPRASAENDLAKAILDEVVAVTAKAGASCSVATRLYLVDIGAAEYVPAS